MSDCDAIWIARKEIVTRNHELMTDFISLSFTVTYLVNLYLIDYIVIVR